MELVMNRFEIINAAAAEYAATRNVDGDSFKNILNLVGDGEELITALTAQSNLMEIVENHNIMRNRNEQCS
jgi:hypothetical protein